MNNKIAKGLIILLLPLLCGLPACIGLGSSFPSTKIINETSSSTSVFFDSVGDAPREPLEGETITVTRGTYIYSKGPSECYQHILIIPMWIGNCQQQEIWSRNNTNTFTVSRKTFHLWGFWCSFFPFFTTFPSLLTGTEADFSICDLHLGTRMHTKNHF